MHYRKWYSYSLCIRTYGILILLFLPIYAYAGPINNFTAYKQSPDCLAETVTTPGCYTKTLVESSILWTVYKASGTQYVLDETGGAFIERIITDASNQATAFTICGDGTPGCVDTPRVSVFCDVSTGCRVAFYNAANELITEGKAVYSGSNWVVTIDTGGTQTDCLTITDAGVMTFAANESCGRLLGLVHLGFTEDDGTHTCAAGDYGAWADTSETKLKVCQNGVVSDWVGGGGAGDIEGVTAGVGLSGGGTSGTVTVTWDATEITGAVTWGDNSQASQVVTRNLSGTDVVETYSSGLLAITGNQTISGTLGVTGVPTLTIGPTVTDSTASRCARFDANKKLVPSTGDCADGDTTNYTFDFTGEDPVGTPAYAVADNTSTGTAFTASDTASPNLARYIVVDGFSLTKICCEWSAIAAATTYTITARKNGVNTACTSAMTNADLDVCVTTCAISFASLDQLSLEIADSTANDTTNRMRCTLKGVRTP